MHQEEPEHLDAQAPYFQHREPLLLRPGSVLGAPGTSLTTGFSQEQSLGLRYIAQLGGERETMATD